MSNDIDERVYDAIFKAGQGDGGYEDEDGRMWVEIRGILITYRLNYENVTRNTTIENTVTRLWKQGLLLRKMIYDQDYFALADATEILKEKQKRADKQIPI